jgi:hypothetical protein
MRPFESSDTGSKIAVHCRQGNSKSREKRNYVQDIRLVINVCDGFLLGSEVAGTVPRNALQPVKKGHILSVGPCRWPRLPVVREASFKPLNLKQNTLSAIFCGS